MSLTCIQGVHEVLNHNYTPQTTKECDIFDLKHAFMYNVFDRTLLFSHGKTLVQEREHDYDAQLLYQLLMTYFKRSTKGILAAAEILGYLTNIKLEDGTWKGKVHDFILHWLDKMCQYENMVLCSDILSDNVKKTLLENAMHQMDDLCHVKTESNQHLARSGTSLTFQAYTQLLISAAINHDEHFVWHKPSTSKIQSIMAHAVAGDVNIVLGPTPLNLILILIFKISRYMLLPTNPCTLTRNLVLLLILILAFASQRIFMTK